MVKKYFIVLSCIMMCVLSFSTNLVSAEDDETQTVSKWFDRENLTFYLEQADGSKEEIETIDAFEKAELRLYDGESYEYFLYNDGSSRDVEIPKGEKRILRAYLTKPDANKLGFHFYSGSGPLSEESYEIDENSDLSHFVFTFKLREYDTTSGEGTTYEKGSDDPLTFTFKNESDDTNTFNNFTGIQIDGEDVDSSNYTAVEGSVIITLNKDYVDTLSVGAHTIKALFKDGESEATFTINGNSETPSDDVKPTPTPSGSTTPSVVLPKTGVDTINITPMVSLLAASILTALRMKKK